MMEAAERGRLDVLRRLYSGEARPPRLSSDDFCAYDCSVVQKAAEGGHLEVLQWLHSEDGPGLGQGEFRAHQNACLCHAAKNGHVAAVEFLLREVMLTPADARQALKDVPREVSNPAMDLVRIHAAHHITKRASC